jgi:hypothetical protein
VLTSNTVKPRFAGFTVLYLAFHGSPGRFYLDDGECITLEELGDFMAGKCDGKIVHFGSCATLRADEERLRDFRKQTKAKALTGYRRNVDWLEAAAFESLLMSRLTAGGYVGSAIKRVKQMHPDLCRALEFVSV